MKQKPTQKEEIVVFISTEQGKDFFLGYTRLKWTQEMNQLSRDVLTMNSLLSTWENLDN